MYEKRCTKCGKKFDFFCSDGYRRIETLAKVALENKLCEPKPKALQEWFRESGIYRRWKVPPLLLEEIIERIKNGYVCYECERLKKAGLAR